MKRQIDNYGFDLSPDYVVIKGAEGPPGKDADFPPGGVVGQVLKMGPNGPEWGDCKEGGNDPFFVGNVKGFTAMAEDSCVYLSWKDPEDLMLEEEVLAGWAGTKIIRKEGDYPVTPDDGVLVVTSEERDQYYEEPFKDTGLENDTEYFYVAFPYTLTGNVTISPENRVSAIPTGIKIYGVRIDENNSNPATAVVYIDDAVNFTPAAGNNGNFDWGSWEDIYPFSEIRPVLFKDGEVVTELQRNNFTSTIDGVGVNIGTGSDGDVMIEFPKIWWKLYREGDYLFVKYATGKVDETWKCLAHAKGEVEKDFIYIGAYLGVEQNNRLRSISGKESANNKNISAFRTLAQANGEGYQQVSFYPLMMLQILYLLMFKNLDSQTALGRGWVDSPTNPDYAPTGGTNLKGFNYGETTGKLQMKFLGLEDYWGNRRWWIDGCFYDSNRNMLIGTENFNNTGSGYTNQGQGASATLNGQITKVQGTTETGFIPKKVGGSETTYYCDYGYLHSGHLLAFGGTRVYASAAGGFYLYSYSASTAAAMTGGRLCFV